MLWADARRVLLLPTLVSGIPIFKEEGSPSPRWRDTRTNLIGASELASCWEAADQVTEGKAQTVACACGEVAGAGIGFALLLLFWADLLGQLILPLPMVSTRRGNRVRLNAHLKYLDRQWERPWSGLAALIGKCVESSTCLREGASTLAVLNDMLDPGYSSHTPPPPRLLLGHVKSVLVLRKAS